MVSRSACAAAAGVRGCAMMLGAASSCCCGCNTCSPVPDEWEVTLAGFGAGAFPTFCDNCPALNDTFTLTKRTGPVAQGRPEGACQWQYFLPSMTCSSGTLYWWILLTVFKGATLNDTIISVSVSPTASNDPNQISALAHTGFSHQLSTSPPPYDCPSVSGQSLGTRTSSTNNFCSGGSATCSATAL